METKTCTKCGECKPVGAFYSRKDAADGLRNDCKQCCKTRVSSYAKGNPVVLAAKQAYRAQQDRSAYLADQRRRYEANRQRYKDQAKRWGILDRSRLGDTYIKTVLAQGTGLSRKSFDHQPLIEAKRQQLKLQRLINERTKP